ncbi:MAG TPA: hypothetical protein VHO25_07385 [Polyangiaceae bacterium]|nr:hypothetical protein [Polyangiaceae bacterium]
MAMVPTHPSTMLKALRMGAGSLIFLLGVVLLFFPGPGLLLMAVGLGMIHPPWGERIQIWFKHKLEQHRQRKQPPPEERPPAGPPDTPPIG